MCCGTYIWRSLICFSSGPLEGSTNNSIGMSLRTSILPTGQQLKPDQNGRWKFKCLGRWRSTVPTTSVPSSSGLFEPPIGTKSRRSRAFQQYKYQGAGGRSIQIVSVHSNNCWDDFGDYNRILYDCMYMYIYMNKASIWKQCLAPKFLPQPQCLSRICFRQPLSIRSHNHSNDNFDIGIWTRNKLGSQTTYACCDSNPARK